MLTYDFEQEESVPQLVSLECKHHILQYGRQIRHQAISRGHSKEGKRSAGGFLHLLVGVEHATLKLY